MTDLHVACGVRGPRPPLLELNLEPQSLKTNPLPPPPRAPIIYDLQHLVATGLKAPTLLHLLETEALQILPQPLSTRPRPQPRNPKP